MTTFSVIAIFAVLIIGVAPYNCLIHSHNRVGNALMFLTIAAFPVVAVTGNQCCRD